MNTSAPHNQQEGQPLLTALYGLASLYSTLMLSLTMLVPLLLALIVPNLRWRRTAVRITTRLSFFLSALPVQQQGQVLSNQPCIVVANHASYLDGLILQACLPANFSLLVKGESEDWPVVGLALRRLGLLFVARGDAQRSSAVLRRLIRGLIAQESFALFPEGTFRLEPGLINFQPGAFHVAARSKVPIQPVVIHGSRVALPDGHRMIKPQRLKLEFLPPCTQQEGAADPVQALMQTVRESMLNVLKEPNCPEILGRANQP